MQNGLELKQVPTALKKEQKCMCEISSESECTVLEESGPRCESAGKVPHLKARCVSLCFQVFCVVLRRKRCVLPVSCLQK